VWHAVQEALPGAERLGHPERALPHILSLRLPGVVGQTLLERCSARGVAFSTGSACHGVHHDAGRDDARDSGRAADNHVLAAIGFDRRAAREVIRLSFCRDNTEAEVARAAKILVEEVLLLRQLSPRSGSEGSVR
jgi:cysteine desulfurase